MAISTGKTRRPRAPRKRKTDGITETQIERFIHLYVSRRDTVKAAEAAHITLENAKLLMRREDVKAKIDKRIDIYEGEVAKLEAQAMHLTVHQVDAALLEEIKSKKTPAVRVKAIELAYDRLGRRVNGAFPGATDPEDKPLGASIYRAMQTTRRTLTEETTHAIEVCQPLELPAPSLSEQNAIVVEY